MVDLLSTVALRLVQLHTMVTRRPINAPDHRIVLDEQDAYLAPHGGFPRVQLPPAGARERARSELELLRSLEASPQLIDRLLAVETLLDELAPSNDTMRFNAVRGQVRETLDGLASHSFEQWERELFERNSAGSSASRFYGAKSARQRLSLFVRRNWEWIAPIAFFVALVGFSVGRLVVAIIGHPI